MNIPFRLPAEFSDPNLYERFGSLVKDKATGRIVAHLQETSSFELLRHLPIPGGNVLGLITDTVQTIQLAKIQQTLNAVQSMESVGAVASVASIGISVAGFELVMGKLRRMDGKLDRLLSGAVELRNLVVDTHVKLDAIPLARLNAELEGVGMAYFYDSERRRDSLQKSIGELRALRHYYGILMSNEKFCALGTNNLAALLDTHERLIATSEGELFAEFLLGSETEVIEECWASQKRLFEGIAWQTPAELFELALQGDRAQGVDLIISPRERSSKVKALSEVRYESLRRLESLVQLASTVRRLGLNPIDYLRAVEERGATGELLLALDAR
jgi:hypothetical protein